MFWLQSLSAMILEPKKIKFVIVSTFLPSICHETMEPDAMRINIGSSNSTSGIATSSDWEVHLK